LNKTIPPEYVMGFPVDTGQLDFLYSQIQNPNQKVSIRFKAELTGTITNATIYAFAYNGQPIVKVGLQQDDGTGNPIGWMNENTFGTLQLPATQGFRSVQLQHAMVVTKGLVYHLVVEPADSSFSGSAAIFTYETNYPAQPSNPDDPDILWNDDALNVLMYDAGWHPVDKWPIFAVGYSDGSMTGQPYSLAAPWVVHASTYVGQMVMPASDYKVGKIAFSVSLNTSSALTAEDIPQDSLYYQIRDSNNTILAQGTFAQPSQLSHLSQTWIEVTLTTAVTLKAGQLYRIFVLSPGSDPNNDYFFYGYEFSLNNLGAYGGLQHQLTLSTNGGTTWGDNKDADAMFKLTTTA